MHRYLFPSLLGCCCWLFVLAPGCTFDSKGHGNSTEAPLCGNGRIDPGEGCDGAALDGQTCVLRGFSGGNLTCSTGCQFDVSGCEGIDPCGNGQIDPGEECDGEALGGQTCVLRGFAGGELACSAGCKFDVSGCEGMNPCGNGQIDPGEECDGDELGDQTCASLGMGVGDLGCDADCRYDVGGCKDPPVCGDGKVDAGEACDDGGTDACSGTCNEDCTGPANTCGDGIVRCGEECEEGDLMGADCTDYGYAAPGGLTCKACKLDPSGCHSDCGNGVLDPGEVCEDGNTAPENGTTDFCGPLCTTESWPCAGGWPGFITPVNESETWVTFSNTSLAGSTTRYAIGEAGSTVAVSGSFAYDTAASGCPGCVVQLYWGFFAGNQPASDADPNAGFKHCHHNVQSNPNTNYSFNLTLPNQPGTYYLRWGRSWEYSCNYNVGVPGEARSLAVICVY